MTEARSGPANGPTNGLRPRYGRVSAFASAVTVSGLAFLGGLGVLPDGGTASHAAAPSSGAIALTAGVRHAEKLGASAVASYPPTTPPLGAESSGTDSGEAGPAVITPPTRLSDPEAPDDDTSAGVLGDAGLGESHPLPAGSGTGRRVVFDQTEQRVWVVDADGTVRRTYLVSGSLTDNLDPGTYEVFSRSLHATGIDGSSMDYMVRFAHGDNAAIGFHDIPEMNGDYVQGTDDLGTPASHGCIRQAPENARAMWRFAKVGTTVVVTS